MRATGGRQYLPAQQGPHISKKITRWAGLPAGMETVVSSPQSGKLSLFCNPQSDPGVSRIPYYLLMLCIELRNRKSNNPISDIILSKIVRCSCPVQTQVIGNNVGFREFDSRN